jgi:hypothetical protein
MNLTKREDDYFLEEPQHSCGRDRPDLDWLEWEFLSRETPPCLVCDWEDNPPPEDDDQ